MLLPYSEIGFQKVKYYYLSIFNELKLKTKNNWFQLFENLQIFLFQRMEIAPI